MLIPSHNDILGLMFCITPGVLLGKDFFDFVMTVSDVDDGEW